MKFKQALEERRREFKYSIKDYEKEMLDSSFREKEFRINPEKMKVYCKYCGSKLKGKDKCQKCKRHQGFKTGEKKNESLDFTPFEIESFAYSDDPFQIEYFDDGGATDRGPTGILGSVDFLKGKEKIRHDAKKKGNKKTKFGEIV